MTDRSKTSPKLSLNGATPPRKSPSRKATKTPVPAATLPIAAAGLRTICVYCGSGPGRNPAYLESARTLGTEMAKAGIGLVYGGGSLGLMGETARSVLDAGGRVTGIIPQFLSNLEKQLEEVSELIVTVDMHERKRLMFERSDAFVALPGGIGTLEELVEQLTWWQLGRHNKPILLLNVDGFWNPFIDLIQHMRAEAFIRPALEVEFLVANSAGEVLSLLEKASQRRPEDHPNQKFLQRL